MKKIFLLLFSLLFCSTLFAGPIKEIIFLGDSLSDNGNLYKILRILPKSPPYYEGRFSNGPTWAERVGNYYYDKYYTHYKIYALGGATALLHDPIQDIYIAPTTLTAEVYAYLIDSLFNDKSGSLISIWIGGNDYLFDKEMSSDALTTKVVNKISWAITTLIQQGAHQFLILNLPDLSRIPFAKYHSFGDRLRVLSELHNQKLADAVKKIRNTYPGIKITLIDTYDLFNDLMANPEKYNQKYNINIKNTIESCWPGGFVFKAELKLEKDFDVSITSKALLSSPELFAAYATGQAYALGLSPCEHAEQYVFWDQIHPTEVMHELIAKVVLANLNTAL